MHETLEGETADDIKKIHTNSQLSRRHPWSICCVMDNWCVRQSYCRLLWCVWYCQAYSKCNHLALLSHCKNVEMKSFQRFNAFSIDVLTSQWKLMGRTWVVCWGVVRSVFIDFSSAIDHQLISWHIGSFSCFAWFHCVHNCNFWIIAHMGHRPVSSLFDASRQIGQNSLKQFCCSTIDCHSPCHHHIPVHI